MRCIVSIEPFCAMSHAYSNVAMGKIEECVKNRQTGW